MRLLRQLEFAFEQSVTRFSAGREAIEGRALRLPTRSTASDALALPLRGRDVELERNVRELLRSLGARRLAREVRVEWNPRLQTAAGRADYRAKLISLNPRIRDHGPEEIDRTMRHELAHLLAQFRARRRRIEPHGVEWRDACRELGIADEVRCHNLPFAARTFPVRFLYRCPNCRREFPRVRRLRRAVACLACCRKHNGGDFDPRFKLYLVNRDLRARC
jgi:SprT protein